MRQALLDWEIAIIRGLQATGMGNQEILAYFTRPTRSVNQARIAEIRNGGRKGTAKDCGKVADEAAVDAFLAAWPDIDHLTGLAPAMSLQSGEWPVHRARDAMLAAVRGFNTTGRAFRTELFLTNALLAWRYLSEARAISHPDDQDTVTGPDVTGTAIVPLTAWYLDLPGCSYPGPVVENILLLTALANEFSAGVTTPSDGLLCKHLSTCVDNFRNAIVGSFGKAYAIPLAQSLLRFAPGYDDASSLSGDAIVIAGILEAYGHGPVDGQERSDDGA